MVVCKCRKATKLYCFVHKAPVCGECISEHQLCVVRTYSEWVIDGDYDWPTKCSLCQQAFQDGDAESTVRLGCLHLLHTVCLDKHLKSFPAHTAPAGYVCPSCSSPVWPPKYFRDVGSGPPSRLKEILSEAIPNIVANSDPILSPREAPPAFSSAPLASSTGVNPADKDSQGQRAILPDTHSVGFTDANSLLGSRGQGNVVSGSAVPEIEVAGSTGPLLSSTGPSSSPHFQQKSSTPASLLPGALARKSSYSRGERSPLLVQDGYADDEDASRRKYTRRGPISRQLMKLLVPIWSPSIPILPVTAPRDSVVDDSTESRPRRRSSRSAPVDPRRVLLFFAIMSCMATMMLLYYRLSQSNNSQEQREEQ
eukprot:TRINITY_DN7256_c0_g1_i1.p1 TRINITY_DN7256_c0_g1~~TRINITY_DN7256_c0_g1_i1.p1  ORF type:complete len:367 (+),score=25.05 TRINITY_DN7256_c0_g1_i1:83-1183(+)